MADEMKDCSMCRGNGCQLCTKPEQYPATLIQFGNARWEYCQVKEASLKNFMGMLNEQGADGWELVSMTDLSNSFWGVMKRRLP